MPFYFPFVLLFIPHIYKMCQHISIINKQLLTSTKIHNYNQLKHHSAQNAFNFLYLVYISCTHLLFTFALVVHVSKFKTHVRCIIGSPPSHRQYFLDFIGFPGIFTKYRVGVYPTLTRRECAPHPKEIFALPLRYIVMT